MEIGERKKNRGEGCLINDVIGEELLTEILIRLPTDQTFRCKSVCKRWLSLIQSPLFAAYYTKKHKENGEKKRMQITVRAHPQQKSPVLITARSNLKFTLDFVPDFAQLHGVDNYNDFLQRAADDKDNYDNHCRELMGQKIILREGTERQRQFCYYSYRDFILGSSNGLLLCSTLLFTSPTLTPVFDDFAPIYVVCNPYTKQWLQIPPPPPLSSSSSISSPHAVNAGFVSDFDSSTGACWFKIVLLPLNLPRGCSIELQVFSSHSWEWTTVTVPPLPPPTTKTTTSVIVTLPRRRLPVWADEPRYIVVAVTLKKKNDHDDGPRLCWLVNGGTRAIVYDPIKNVVDAVVTAAGAMQPRVDNVSVGRVVGFDAMCVSDGCLWAGSCLRRGGQKKLRIYRALGKEWEMVEEFDMTQIYNAGEPGRRSPVYNFMTMDPDDPRLVFLVSSMGVAALNLRTKKFKVVKSWKTNRGLKGLTIVCDNPPWPTSLPSPFPASSSS